MILVDTSVWVDHLRRGDVQLADLLKRAQVVMHPFVLGELACGGLRGRATILELLAELPPTEVADGAEVLRFIELQNLHGNGIGYVDVHLLASVALTHGAKLWTRDKKLHAVALDLRCAFEDSAAH